MITVYHGTSLNRWNEIRRTGLRGPSIYVFKELEEAQPYAVLRAIAEHDPADKPIGAVISFKVSEGKLRLDTHPEGPLPAGKKPSYKIRGFIPFHKLRVVSIIEVKEWDGHNAETEVYDVAKPPSKEGLVDLWKLIGKHITGAREVTP